MIKTEIENSLEILQQKAILLYPTDTVWGIGCDASNKEAHTYCKQLVKHSLVIEQDPDKRDEEITTEDLQYR